MTTERITISEYCLHHHTDVTFIDALEQNGLIQTVDAGDERSIEYAQLGVLERYTRWYLDLDLNVEGIEVVQHLLQKVNALQERIQVLEEQLKRYE